MSMDVLPTDDRAGVEWTPDGYPQLTRHAIERWDERTPAWSVAPETALAEATRLTALVGWDSFFPKNGHAVWVYLGRDDEGWFAAGLMERNECIVTVLTAQSCNDPRSAAALLTCAIAESRGDDT